MKLREVKKMPDNEIYNRQNQLNLRIPDTVTVVGCGGTGFWTAIFLAMSGVEHLILIDNDSIETSNLNRLPIQPDKVGFKKVTALEGYIKTLRPEIRIECQEKRIETTNSCQILRGSVFCCTDNLKSQQLICAYCRKNHLRYQRIGYDGLVLNVSKAFPLSFKEEEENQPGYTITPSWVVPAAVAAGLGVFSKLFKELSIMDNLAKLNIANCSYIPEEIQDNLREEGKEDIIDNIDDYIPEGYGYCQSCTQCENCDRVHLEDGYGYCEDCERLSEDDLEEVKEQAYEEGRQKGFQDAVDQVKSGDIEEAEIEEALEDWFNLRIKEVEKGELSTDLIKDLEKAIEIYRKVRPE